jgi:osmotically-inducible protein OsmY
MTPDDTTPFRRAGHLFAVLTLTGGLVAGTGAVASAGVEPSSSARAVAAQRHDNCEYFRAKARDYEEKARHARAKAAEFRHKAHEADQHGDHDKASEYRQKAKYFEDLAKDYDKEAREYWKKYRDCTGHDH